MEVAGTAGESNSTSVRHNSRNSCHHQEYKWQLHVAMTRDTIKWKHYHIIIYTTRKLRPALARLKSSHKGIHRLP